MRALKTKILTVFLLAFWSLSGEVMALAPVESLVLGNFSDDYSENKSDPLNYVYSRDLTLKNAPTELKKSSLSTAVFMKKAKTRQITAVEVMIFAMPLNGKKFRLKDQFLLLFSILD